MVWCKVLFPLYTFPYPSGIWDIKIGFAVYYLCDLGQFTRPF